jgi:hypothetical protein
LRWLEEAENDLKRMKVKGWKEKTDREQWRLAVEEAKGCSAKSSGGQGFPRAVVPSGRK